MKIDLPVISHCCMCADCIDTPTRACKHPKIGERALPTSGTAPPYWCPHREQDATSEARWVEEQIRSDERMKCVAELNDWEKRLGVRPPAGVLFMSVEPRELTDEDREVVNAVVARLKAGVA